MKNKKIYMYDLRGIHSRVLSLVSFLCGVGSPFYSRVQYVGEMCGSIVSLLLHSLNVPHVADIGLSLIDIARL